MSFISAIQNVFNRFSPASLGVRGKASATAPLIGMLHNGQPVFTPRRYDKLAEEGYQKNVIAYRCVDEIARPISSFEWQVFRRSSGGDRELLDDQKNWVSMLLRGANPFQSWGDLLYHMTAFYLIAGNSYLEEVGPDGRPPRELWALRPDRMEVIPGPSGPSGYKYEVGGRKKTWKIDELSGESKILHLKTFHPLNDFYGMSPIEAAAFGIDVHNATDAWNKGVLDNGARPSLIFAYEPNSDGYAELAEDSTLEKAKSDFQEQYAGSKNAAKTVWLQGGFRVEQFGFAPADMDFINSKHTSARDICHAFGVPPFLLGIPGDNTYSNQKEARLALMENTVLPLGRKIRDEVNRHVIHQYDPNLELDIDENAIPSLGPRREAQWDRVNEATFLTVNERREELGMEPIDGGDVVLVPSGMIPLSQAGQDDPEDGNEPGDDLDEESGTEPGGKRKRIEHMTPAEFIDQLRAEGKDYIEVIESAAREYADSLRK